MGLFMQVEGHSSAHVGTYPMYQGWIPLIGVELGTSRARKFGGNEEANREVGQTGVTSITVQKELDSSTGFLSQTLAQGRSPGKVVVDICETKDGKFVRRLVRHTIEDANFASYRVSRDAGPDGGWEEIVLVGAKIEMERGF